jgi:anti-anti-sigma factor
MHFTIDQQDATTIFRLKSSADAPARLDSSNAGPLKAEFLILAQPDVETLIVDLSEVTYVDSAGLSALLLAERQQSAHGGDVRLVGASETVQSLLRLTQLDRVFSLYRTVEEAMTAEPESQLLEDTELKTAPMTARQATGIAAGGALGAAALAAIMMGPAGDDDDGFEDDDFDDDFDDDDEDDLDDDEFEDEKAPKEAAVEGEAVVDEEISDEDPDEEDLEDDLDLDDFEDLDDDEDDDFEEDDLL